MIKAENAGILISPDFSVNITQWVSYTVIFGLTGVLTHFSHHATCKALLQMIKESTERKIAEDAFLQAVLSHQSELQSIRGMSVELLLAMGAAESGAANEWDQESLNGGGPVNSDGVLQVTHASGFKGYTARTLRPGYGAYNNSATGYDNNVRDAIAYLKHIAAGTGREGVEIVFGPLPSGDSIKLMLYYNGGDSSPIATYRDGGGNPLYLSQTAEFLINSLYGCSYDAPILAADLMAAQPILTHRINHPEEP